MGVVQSKPLSCDSGVTKANETLANSRILKDTRLALPYEMCNLEQALEHHEKVSEIAGRLRGREGEGGEEGEGGREGEEEREGEEGEGWREGEEEREERRRGRNSGKEMAITLFPTAV